MSSAVVAEGNHQGPAGPNAVRTLFRFPDFLALGIALPVFILADWPLAGWAAAAIAWFVQGVVIFQMEQKALRATEPRHQVGLVVGASLVRAWIAAAAILAAGLIFGDPAGLACALLTIALFTIYFAGKMFFHFTSPAEKA